MNARRVLYYALHLLGAVAAMSFPCGAAMAAPTAQPPNIVFMMADDKYDWDQPKAENTRKNPPKRLFCRGFQITGNCGKLGQITAN